MLKLINDKDISVMFNDNIYYGKMLRCRNGSYNNLKMPKNLYTHWQLCYSDGIYIEYIVQVDDNVNVLVNLN